MRGPEFIYTPALWLLHMEWKVWTLTPDFSLPNISSSQASLSGFHTAHTFSPSVWDEILFFQEQFQITLWNHVVQLESIKTWGGRF
jgi:hypothetical protein